MDSKKLGFLSLSVTIGMFLWTLFIPLWNAKDWFVDERFQYMWFLFDIIFIILLSVLTYFIFSKNKFSQVLAPVLFGMIITDWIFNVGLWIFADYNLFEIRFLLSYLFIIITTSMFGWFFWKVYNFNLVNDKI